jgi:hypothetical protein
MPSPAQVTTTAFRDTYGSGWTHAVEIGAIVLAIPVVILLTVVARAPDPARGPASHQLGPGRGSSIVATSSSRSQTGRCAEATHLVWHVPSAERRPGANR